MKKGLVLLATIVAVILIGAMGLAAFFIIRKHNAEVAGKIAKLMDVMKNEIAHDSFAGYKTKPQPGRRDPSVRPDIRTAIHPAHNVRSPAIDAGYSSYVTKPTLTYFQKRSIPRTYAVNAR